MDFDEYREHDGIGLGELVASGGATPAELLELAIARADAVNPALNAIHRPLHAFGRARAAEPFAAGPFSGVPFLIKDLGQDLAGFPTGSGSRALQDFVMEADAEVVRRWKDADLVIFGKTATPEFGAVAVTEPDVAPPTRNPWNLAHTPGGSSGGAAAAVAAGVVPVAGASDGGGSIRIPASCCGLLGLKPGRGLISSGPLAAEQLHGAATDGVISRTVRDSAAMLDVMSTPDPGGPFFVARPQQSYRELAARAPGKLRIGYTTTSPLGSVVHPEAIAAVTNAVTLLRDLGHDVEAAEVPIDQRQMSADFLTMWFVNLAAAIDLVRQHAGARSAAFEADTLTMAQVGRTVRGTDYVAMHNRWNDHNRGLAAFHADYDLLLTPTIAFPPLRIGQLATPRSLRAVSRIAAKLPAGRLMGALGLVDRIAMENFKKTPFTQLANLTGRPAISVPTHTTAGGLPLGIQFVGPLSGEGTLLSLAGQIEQAAPWDTRRAMA